MRKIEINNVETVQCKERLFYYDKEKELLFYIAGKDTIVNNYKVVEKGEVFDSIGLSEENWNKNPNYWVEKYNDQLDKQLE